MTWSDIKKGLSPTRPVSVDKEQLGTSCSWGSAAYGAVHQCGAETIKPRAPAAPRCAPCVSRPGLACVKEKALGLWGKHREGHKGTSLSEGPLCPLSFLLLDLWNSIWRKLHFVVRALGHLWRSNASVQRQFCSFRLCVYSLSIWCSYKFSLEPLNNYLQLLNQNNRKPWHCCYVDAPYHIFYTADTKRTPCNNV